MSGQVNIKNLTGLQGGVVMSGNQTETGRFHAIQALTATTLGTVSTNLDQTTTSLTGKTIPAGSMIFGDFTSIQTTAGDSIAYNK
jgi:hypothetical protein